MGQIQEIKKALRTSGLKPPKTGIKKLHDRFNEWLLITDWGALIVTVAAVIANLLPGDPLWLFLVTAPSGVKTEYISSLNGLPKIRSLSDLTAQTFASGMKAKNDPSLLPKLSYGTVLTFKDFTTVLSMHRDKRHEIFSQLREIYDGAYSKSWGTGKTLNWKGKIGLIAGVTTIIDTHYSIYQILGERFIQYRISQPEPDEVAEVAMRNQGHEKQMREALAIAVQEFVEELNLEVVPKLGLETIKKLAKLSSFVVLARSGVIRDRYGSKEITYVPELESPPRLAKQLALLAKSLMICGLSAEEAYRLCCKVGFDSIHRIRVAVLRLLTKTEGALSTASLAEATQYPTNTVRRYLEDLAALKAVKVEKYGQGKADLWRISEDTLERLQTSESEEVLLGVPQVSMDKKKPIYI